MHDFAHADYYSMNHALSTIDWHCVFNGCTDVEVYWSVFHDIMISLINQFVSIRKLKFVTKCNSCAGLKRQ